MNRSLSVKLTLAATSFAVAAIFTTGYVPSAQAGPEPIPMTCADGTHGTPDSCTPAEEIICDGLSGKQLGWCTAFCEATDCNLVEQNASETACHRLLTKYFDDSNRLPPCMNCAAQCKVQAQASYDSCLAAAGTNPKAQTECVARFKNAVNACAKNCSKTCQTDCAASFDPKLDPTRFKLCVGACGK